MADFGEIVRNIVLNSSSVNAVETILRGGGFSHHSRRVGEGDKCPERNERHQVTRGEEIERREVLYQREAVSENR